MTPKENNEKKKFIYSNPVGFNERITTFEILKFVISTMINKHLAYLAFD
jgi:hypothetical protein